MIGESLWCRDEGTGRIRNQEAAPLKRRHINGARQEVVKARMHMGMVVVEHGRVTRTISTGCPIVNMIITMLVAVMPEMCSSVTRRVFQRIADTHRCRVGSVQ